MALWPRRRAARQAQGPLPAVESYPGDFADPFILATPGSWWAYATGFAGRNLQAMASADLATWTAIVDPLPSLPSWAGPGLTWSPAVVSRPDGFVMWFTARYARSGRQSLSWATAADPGGPFHDASDGPVVHQAEEGGSIDPDVFIDTDGGAYLLWKSEGNAVGRPTRLWAQRLDDDGRGLLGRPIELLALSRPWQGKIIEGPAMVCLEGTYVLFYGANDWKTDLAGIGYATGPSPLGPFVDRCPRQAWLASSPGAPGPAGPAVFIDEQGKLALAYHAWHGAVRYRNGGVRSLRLAGLGFADGAPVLRPRP